MELKNKITDEQLHKYEQLKQYLQSFEKVAVAFSAGVDSTFLLKVAKEVLGENVLAVTVHAESFPKREMEEAEEFCKKEGIKQCVCRVNQLEIEGFAKNPKNRCYLCKKHIFSTIIEALVDTDIVLEGSNMDDMGDYRPGLQAIAELGVKSPLRECGLSKADIRALSKMLDLPTWEKPSFACLATRFVYGETISREKLGRVEQAEQLLLDLGFEQVRVRMHDNLARIEILPNEFERLMNEEIRTIIDMRFKEYGFSYVTIDLSGYRTGSMNETILIEGV